MATGKQRYFLLLKESVMPQKGRVRREVHRSLGRWLIDAIQPTNEKKMPNHLQLAKLGIQEIDEQHGQLIACFDRLELWVGKGHGFAAALDALNTLKDYVAKHFAYEEAFLGRQGYPKLQEHIEEHGKITAELARLNQQVLDGGEISNDLVGMVRDWIITHIGVEDVEYANILS